MNACVHSVVVHGVFLLGRAQLFSVVFFFFHLLVCVFFFFGRLELCKEQLPTVDPLARTSMKTVAKCDIVLRIAEFSESSNC